MVCDSGMEEKISFSRINLIMRVLTLYFQSINTFLEEFRLFPPHVFQCSGCSFKGKFSIEGKSRRGLFKWQWQFDHVVWAYFGSVDDVH